MEGPLWKVLSTIMVAVSVNIFSTGGKTLLMDDGMHWSGHKKNRAGGKSLMGTFYVTKSHKCTTFSLIPHQFF